MTLHISTDADLFMTLNAMKSQPASKILSKSILVKSKIFEILDIKAISRNINGKNTQVFSVDNIVISKKNRGQGYFKMLYSLLEMLNVPLMWYDVINNDLATFLKTKGYSEVYVCEKNYMARCFLK